MHWHNQDVYVVSVGAPQLGPVYQGWSPCMDWCKDHCQGFWSYDTEGVFVFKLAQDATAFALRWAT